VNKTFGLPAEAETEAIVALGNFSIMKMKTVTGIA
jgi:hypothetical protein